MSIQKVFQTEDLRNFILQHYYAKRYFQRIYEYTGHLWYDNITLEELIDGGALDNITIGTLQKFRNENIYKLKSCLKSKYREQNIAKFDKTYTFYCKCVWKSWKQEFIITPIVKDEGEIKILENVKFIILKHPNHFYDKRKKTKNQFKEYFTDYICEFADNKLGRYMDSGYKSVKQSSFLEYMYKNTIRYFPQNKGEIIYDWKKGEHITKNLMGNKKEILPMLFNYFTMISYNHDMSLLDILDILDNNNFEAFIKDVYIILPNPKILEFINNHYGNLSDLLSREYTIKRMNQEFSSKKDYISHKIF